MAVRRLAIGRILTALCSLAVLSALVPCSIASEPEKLPNIIVILADDMGIDSVGAFNDQLGLETPALDRLVAQGTSFIDAHSTSAVCSPTRYGLLTGRYNWRSRLKKGIVGKWERPLIEQQRLTLPEMLRERGYATAMIGKWHLGWHWPAKDSGTTESVNQIDFTRPVTGGPNSHGFDYYFGDDVPNWPPYVWRENEMLLGNPTSTMKQGAMVGVSAGPAMEHWDFRAVLKEYGDRCAHFIHQQANQDRPYFLYFPMPSPHTPIAPHADFRGRTGISEYADFLVQTDAVVGQVLAALDETAQTDKTLVFFTCDNGTSDKANFPALEEAGVHLREHWRGWKADVFEGGHRVPFIVRWPGVVEGNVRSNQIITTADIMATCAGVIGYHLPVDAAEDSVSLLPVLLGEGAQVPVHEFVIHHSSLGCFAIRSGPWKLLFCRGSGGWSPPREPIAAQQNLPPLQLYHLGDDPKEQNNLQAEHPELVERLTGCLRQAIEQGRTTSGPVQPNHNDAVWWPGLPWTE